MTDLRAAAQQALEAMESADFDPHSSDAIYKAITALKAALVEDAMQKFTDVNQEIEAALAELVQEPVANDDEVICPACCHQFRAIPPNVQQMMLDAGFEPPFTTPPQRPAEPLQEPVAWRWGYRSVTTGEMDWRGYVEIAAHPNLRSPEIIMQPLYAAPPQRPAEPVQEPQCNPHPKAPHGFLRNASHTENRYVCECEGWEPYEAGYQAGMEAALRAQS